MNAEVEGRDRAARFRSDHGLGAQPVADLVTVIEQASEADVAVLDAGQDEHGMALRDPTRGVVFIGVARTPHPMRQRSTLAHELGHVLFGDWCDGEPVDWSLRSAAEVRADAFARHLLIPIEGLREFLAGEPGSSVTEKTLSTVVQRFLVSPQIASIAMHEAGYIDAETKQAWLNTSRLTAPKLATRYGWSDLYQALSVESNTRRAPQRLLARAIAGYELGVVAPSVIATLRGVTLAEVEADLRAAGIAPASREVQWTPADRLPDVHLDLSELDDDVGDDFRPGG